MATATEYESIKDAGTRYAVSHRTIRRLVDAGTIPAVAIPGGRVMRVKKSDVDALFQPVGLEA